MAHVDKHASSGPHQSTLNSQGTRFCCFVLCFKTVASWQHCIIFHLAAVLRPPGIFEASGPRYGLPTDATLDSIKSPLPLHAGPSLLPKSTHHFPPSNYLGSCIFNAINTAWHVSQSVYTRRLGHLRPLHGWHIDSLFNSTLRNELPADSLLLEALLNPVLREILGYLRVFPPPPQELACRRSARQSVAGFCFETPSSAHPATALSCAAREHRELDPREIRMLCSTKRC